MRRVRLPAIGFTEPLFTEEVPTPEPLDYEVLIEVEAAGVCHRDLIDRGGGVPFMRVPITLGHEVCGRVIAVGRQVAAWKVGDRVGTLHRDACGTCVRCQRGETSVCE